MAVTWLILSEPRPGGKVYSPDPAGLSLAAPRPHIPAMPFPTMPDLAAELELEHARWHPERETLALAAAGAAQVLGPEHSVTRALARASMTMGTVDLWHARLALKTLRKAQRQAIAEAAED